MFAQPETWVAIAFVILMALFAYLGIHKTVLTALDHRAQRIKAELDDAKRLREEAAKLLGEYQTRRASAERSCASNSRANDSRANDSRHATHCAGTSYCAGERQPRGPVDRG